MTAAEERPRGAPKRPPRGTKSTNRRGSASVPPLPDALMPLASVARVLAGAGVDTTYDRLKKAKQRHGADFPTDRSTGFDLHRPIDVAEWIAQAPARGRPKQTASD